MHSPEGRAGCVHPSVASQILDVIGRRDSVTCVEHPMRRSDHQLPIEFVMIRCHHNQVR